MAYRPDAHVKYIVLHYSATPIERSFTAADIDRMHRDRGFREIGYHYFIRRDGTVETGRDLSQPGRFETGAHSKGENGASIGICYEGGVTLNDPNTGRDTRTTAQMKAMVALIRDLLARFPSARVEGHRDMPGASTQCPGFDGAAWWAQWDLGAPADDVPPHMADDGELRDRLVTVTAERDAAVDMVQRLRWRLLAGGTAMQEGLGESAAYAPK